MIKGSNRKMFRKSQRKPGAAKRALGILASSQELMNTVEPKRNPVTGLQEFFMPLGAAMAANAANAATAAGTVTAGALAAGAGRDNRMNATSPASFDSRLAELKQELDRLLEQRQRYESKTGYINPVTGVATPLDSTAMKRANLAGSTLDIQIDQKMREIEAVGREAEQRATEAATNPPQPSGMDIARNMATLKYGPDEAARDFETARKGAAAVSNTALNASTALRNSVEGIEALKPEGSVDDSFLDSVGKSMARGALAGAQLPGRSAQRYYDLGQAAAETSPLFEFEEARQLRGEAAAEREKVAKGQAEKLAEAEKIMEEKANQMGKSGDAGAEAQQAAEATETKDTLSSAIEKLSGGKAEKSGDLGDLLIRVGLSIAAGDDPRAMKNIAGGALKGIQSYEASQAVRDKMKPTLIRTLEAFDDAGLTDKERSALLPLVLSSGTAVKSSKDERLLKEMKAYLSAGDFDSAALIAGSLYNIEPSVAREELMEIAGVDAKQKQPASAATRARATEDDGPGFFDSLFGDD